MAIISQNRIKFIQIWPCKYMKLQNKYFWVQREIMKLSTVTDILKFQTLPVALELFYDYLKYNFSHLQPAG